MIRRFSLLFVFICSLAEAQPAKEKETDTTATSISTANDNPSEKKPFSFDADVSLEYRSDRLRALQNPETTNVRNLSLLANMFENDTSNLAVELLGEENQLGDLNVNVGKLYYQNRFSTFSDHNNMFLRVGVMKLGYGILNEIDGLFAVLPSYYSYLYDLPRGLDTGVTIATEVFNEHLILSGSMYAGKNLRQTDNKNRELDVAPHHIKLAWHADNASITGLNYFSRKYEGQPLVTGFGFEAQHVPLFKRSGFEFSFDLEVWSLTTSLNSLETRGLTGLVAPRFAYKNLFFQPYFASETWSQAGTPDATEIFFTGKLGYVFNKHIQLVLEKTQIKNMETDIYREDSLQARVVSRWHF